MILKTKRLLLKTLDESYAEEVLEFYKKNIIFLKEWEPERNNDFYKIGVHKLNLRNDVLKNEKKELFRVWIFRSGEEKILGTVALSNIIYGVFKSCHLGYKFDKDEVGKGYAIESVKKVIEYGFNELKLHRIEANIMPKNKRSLNLVKKLGFEEEGLAKNYLKINGEWEDHLHMVKFNEKII
ncbi:GNAT family N-acetyltransferase [Haliovirga abyssi]|uniref:Alanine acetyltransferase n=1 Tax=Haliovirga abyssi TaxID=2996794 RepID=A0AAU9DFK7_9FUSO|nr:GNAT family N-acetyltransferase [Haliovirga abyssi]BDU50167.1 alanine acetyltransferase [Haliovirga abyssi]